MTDLHFDIITAIAYSRLVSNTFSPGECTALHQWSNRYIKPSEALQRKLEAVLIEIENTGFSKPALKYNEARELEYMDENTLTWKKVNN